MHASFINFFSSMSLQGAPTSAGHVWELRKWINCFVNKLRLLANEFPLRAKSLNTFNLLKNELGNAALKSIKLQFSQSVISYASKSLTDVERRYRLTEKSLFLFNARKSIYTFVFAVCVDELLVIRVYINDCVLSCCPEKTSVISLPSSYRLSLLHYTNLRFLASDNATFLSKP